MKNQLSQNSSENQMIQFPKPSDISADAPANLPGDFGFRKYSAYCLEKFNAFKESLTTELAQKYADLLDPNGVQYAVNEADSIAAFTPFPSLFLPVLAEEKVQAASQWNARQRAIRARSMEMAA